LKDLTEHFVDGDVVFDGALLKVRRDRVRLPDGSEAVREYIRHPGAVVILALLEDGRVVLERQFRYPHGREFIELPAGKRDPGETPEATGRRELLEAIHDRDPARAEDAMREHVTGFEQAIRQVL